MKSLIKVLTQIFEANVNKISNFGVGAPIVIEAREEFQVLKNNEKFEINTSKGIKFSEHVACGTLLDEDKLYVHVDDVKSGNWIQLVIPVEFLKEAFPNGNGKEKKETYTTTYYDPKIKKWMKVVSSSPPEQAEAPAAVQSKIEIKILEDDFQIEFSNTALDGTNEYDLVSEGSKQKIAFADNSNNRILVLLPKDAFKKKLGRPKKS